MIARLRELLAEATPGPWVRTASGITQVADDGGPDYGEIADPAPDDAALIVDAVNALPALLDRLEAAEAVVEAARTYRENDDDPGALARALDADLRRYDEVRRG